LTFAQQWWQANYGSWTGWFQMHFWPILVIELLQLWWGRYVNLKFSKQGLTGQVNNLSGEHPCAFLHLKILIRQAVWY
jgi:hypothetical protein